MCSLLLFLNFIPRCYLFGISFSQRLFPFFQFCFDSSLSNDFSFFLFYFVFCFLLLCSPLIFAFLSLLYYSPIAVLVFLLSFFFFLFLISLFSYFICFLVVFLCFLQMFFLLLLFIVLLVFFSQLCCHCFCSLLLPVWSHLDVYFHVFICPYRYAFIVGLFFWGWSLWGSTIQVWGKTQHVTIRRTKTKEGDENPEAKGK